MVQNHSHNMHQGHPIDLFLKKYMFFRSIFAGWELKEVICPKMESVAWKNITVGVCWDLMCRISGISFLPETSPPPEGINSPFDHTHVSMPPSTPHLKV